MNTSMMRAIAIVMWIALVMIATAALIVGTVVWHYTQNGFAGLGALLLTAAGGLYYLHKRGGHR